MDTCIFDNPLPKQQLSPVSINNVPQIKTARKYNNLPLKSYKYLLCSSNTISGVIVEAR